MYTRAEARECRTLVRGKPFWVSGGVAEGARVWVGASEQPKTFEPELFRAIVDHFRGKTVKIGSSFHDPSPDSVGRWIVEGWQPRGGNPAVYLTAILVEEGYAEHVRGGWIHFFDERRKKKSETRKGGSQEAESLRVRLLARIDRMSMEHLAAAKAALDETLGEEPEMSPFESLRGDPDFIVPEHPRPLYRRVTPVRITGRPLSRDVIEDRR